MTTSSNAAEPRDADNSDNPWWRGRRRNNVLLRYGSLALLAGCAVGVLVGVLWATQRDDDSSKGTTTLADPPSLLRPASSVPREALGIRELITQVVGADALVASSTTLPYYRQALEWMIHQDPAQLVPFQDANFVQRYICAYFAFALKGDATNEWRSCGPANVTKGQVDTCTWTKLGSTNPVIYVTEPRYRWLSSAHECEWAGIRCGLQKMVRRIEFGT